MKRSKVIVFLGILLLCGILLHATSNNKPFEKLKKSKEITTKVVVKTDFEFIPGSVLL
jgi:hypothetical protein